MSQEDNSDSSTSESEVSPCSSNFNPLKALYSSKSKIPIKNAPMYNNVQQFEASLKEKDVIAVGRKLEVLKREHDKLEKRKELERQLEEKNKQRFAKYEVAPVERKVKVQNNLLTRMERMLGPLGALKECVDKRLRIKVVTRNDKGIRGALHATLVAFDKQWNLALTDVLEVWKRKGPAKRKVPPMMGKPVASGSAAAISPVPLVTETALGGGMWECARHIPQLMVRGEHVVLINLVER